MKLWNTDGNIDRLIETYTIGNDPEYDMRLARYDVQGSLAHAKMLHRIGYLTEDEHNRLEQGLEDILILIENSQFQIEEGVEDVHSQVEFILVRQYGEVGKKLHVGRSRNDQIALDLKLYYRDVLKDLKEKVRALGEAFLKKAEQTEKVLMPGYTHSQAGMVSSFGLWYGSFAESLADDYTLLRSVSEIVDQNPLGSAAGYGSSLPNDREYVTELLNFKGLVINSIYAQTSRGKAEMMMAYAMSNVAMTLNRFANDVCLYSNENYQFLKLPEEYTTGSSIMPHKKNPDVMELTRAKCNQLLALPGRLQLLMTNMQSGYHRDYQLLKEILFPEIDRLNHVLEIVGYCIPQIREKEDIMSDDKYALCYTVENINALVKSGMPFRDAYHQVKEEVKSGSFQPNKNLLHTHIGSIGNLGLDRIIAKFSIS